MLAVFIILIYQQLNPVIFNLTHFKVTEPSYFDNDNYQKAI